MPILRQVGLHDRQLLDAGDKLSMLKVWIALEVRQFISLSVQDVSIILFNGVPKLKKKAPLLTNFIIDLQIGQVRWTLSKLLTTVYAIIKNELMKITSSRKFSL